MHPSILCVVLVVSVQGADILGLFPYPGYSHFMAFQPLLEGLAARGHRVTVASFFPRENPIANYQDISFAHILQDYNNNVSVTHFEEKPSDIYSNVMQLYSFLDLYEPVMASPEIQGLLSKKFDLILTEAFNTDMFLGVVYRLGSPFVALSSCNLLPWSNSRFGNPSYPSFVPGIFYPNDDRMDFGQRLANTLGVWFCQAAYTLLFDPFSQRVAEKYLGPLPPLSEIAKNTSLFLINTHFSLHKPKPFVPAVIEVGGLNVLQPKKLPQKYEKLLNESKNGVIYFSMGSLLRGSSLPAKRKEAFIRAFGRLKQTVLWKWEDDIPDKPDNIHIEKWYPQIDILAHPNVVLFVTHGGLLGLSEAAYLGLPSVCIPMFGDQEHNVGAVVSSKTGIRIPFHSITESSLLEAIETVLGNPMYKENAVEMSKRYRDRPLSALNTAIFWTEYVIRHKGAPFLRSAAVHLTWYQQILLDVILVVGTISLVVSLVLFYTFKLLARKTFCQKIKKTKQS